MGDQKFISFDLKADFGFFKKPDINDIYLTYNMLHKPVLLGILGAIIGLGGYKENGVFPEYYTKLKHLKIGLKPLSDEKGNFTKDMISYNNTTGFASSEAGGNLIVKEQILIKPAYRCFLLLNIDNKDESALYNNIKLYRAEFLPYMGKNDFSAWWSDFHEYQNASVFDFNSNYKISSLFFKTDAVSGNIARAMSMFSSTNESIWTYFEKLPVGFDESLKQYSYGDFVYSNATFKKDMDMSKNGIFYIIDKSSIIQLF